jgi:ribosomal protein S18 acetylase RimI-like enzyme
MEIIRLTPSQQDRAADALTHAFHNDPTYQYIFPDPDDRLRAMPRMWKALTAYSLRFGEGYTTPKVEGVALWLKPGDPGMTLRRLIQTRFGVPRSVIQFNGDARRRMLHMVENVEKARKRLMPMPHWYLWALAVDPVCQGQGIGKALIEPILNRASAENVPCYLETDSEFNVAFYERRGFHIVETLDIGIPNWLMRRD